MSNDMFDDLINKLKQQRAQNTTTKAPSDGFQDVNTNMLASRQAMMIGGRTSATTCRLVSGETFYRSLKVGGWPSKFPLCRVGGTVPQNSPEFEYKRELRVMLVEGNDSIDFSKLDENSANLVTMVEVSTPMQGSILVPKHAIVDVKMGGTDGNGKQVLRG
jgi:hypothetical protein